MPKISKTGSTSGTKNSATKMSKAPLYAPKDSPQRSIAHSPSFSSSSRKSSKAAAKSPLSISLSSASPTRSCKGNGNRTSSSPSSYASKQRQHHLPPRYPSPVPTSSSAAGAAHHHGPDYEQLVHAQLVDLTVTLMKAKSRQTLHDSRLVREEAQKHATDAVEEELEKMQAQLEALQGKKSVHR